MGTDVRGDWFDNGQTSNGAIKRTKNREKRGERAPVGGELADPYICNINEFQLRHEEVSNHVSVPITVNPNVPTIIIFEDTWTNNSPDP
ncbi:hypothetical protein Trydic_g4289 [Trypoxylus dichotomus]